MKRDKVLTPEPCLERAEAFRRARAQFRPRGDWFRRPLEAEGGCGVTGFACTLPVGGRHIYEPSIQMRNRGNGKGGGIAACGLVAADHGVSPEVLQRDYILQIALLDPEARGEAENAFVEPYFDVDQGGLVPTVDDYRDVPLLEARPPDVARYFVRVKPDVLDRFATEKGLFAAGFSEEEAADEFVYQNSAQLNQKLYASLGEKRAFVLSHSRNLLVMKIVGYAEAAVQYYRMPDMCAHVWIAHQRYPTKGRVWHPGGAHPFVGLNEALVHNGDFANYQSVSEYPFVGLNEALVHNGDFANYQSVSEYLAQRNIFPQFLTDTEVAVLLFDLWDRVYGYPLEYIIEALAPTTELDFDRLPADKRRIYRQIQATHIHGSPDGPWFFIVARSLHRTGEFQLIGITDTAMLRPQVFALQEGDVSVGLICSEKQAIDATPASLATEDKRFTPIADADWNARGGSHTAGGAFVLTISPANGSTTASNGNGDHVLRVTDKFGRPVALPAGRVHCDFSTPASPPAATDRETQLLDQAIAETDPRRLFERLRRSVIEEDYDHLRWFVAEIARGTTERAPALGIEALTLAIDRRYCTGDKKRSSVLTVLRAGLEQIFEGQPLCGEKREGSHRRVTWDSREQLRNPLGSETTLLIDARGFQPEGPDSDASLAKTAYALGWRRLIHYNSRGTRFHAVGFGPATDDLRIDCYDNPGDYLGSGMDGLECHVHGNAQDQLGQITKRGKLVVYGDVGQTFLYGAKGGEFYVLGNAAGRPMINAVGRPRVVINGTALDFLAESFMAGDPHNGGGFAILNGVRFDGDGKIVSLELPYPGSNLLSLASGGAIYVRDPQETLVEEQLNAGAYLSLTAADWKLILPYLQENERLFDIQIERDLLSVDGRSRDPREVYRKVVPRMDAEAEAEMESLGG
jgi:glutamate synthase domain-containing protein 1/glutamate synthase domain-containing protein 3